MTEVVPAHAHDELLALQQTLYRSKNPTRRWLHCRRRDWIMAALRATPPAARGRALEVGPGSGVYLPLLAELFAEVTASDVEQSFLVHAAGLAAEHPNVRAVQDDVTASALPARHFDVVLCSEVIEHIGDSSAALREIHRILKPGGTLLLSTPLPASPLEVTSKVAYLPGVVRVVRAIYREPVLDPGHINLLPEAEVRRQLAAAGFRVERHDKSGFYLPLIAEFGGRPAQRLFEAVERRIRGGALGALLWTQYYIARAER
jgi:2-polyprenyl-3-methyl-5-hydroxy-6-metoxy-1,4-benzoquinol methylase